MRVFPKRTAPTRLPPPSQSHDGRRRICRMKTKMNHAARCLRSNLIKNPLLGIDQGRNKFEKTQEASDVVSSRDPATFLVKRRG